MNELKHYGVKGMKWGVRRQEKMLAKAEKILGRPVKLGEDFGHGKITNRGIRKVKRYDELEKAYNKVKKRGDPSFDYVHGYDLETRTVLSDRKIKNIIKKMEKNPSMDVLSATTRAHHAQRGERIVMSLLASTIGAMTLTELTMRYS